MEVVGPTQVGNSWFVACNGIIAEFKGHDGRRKAEKHIRHMEWQFSPPIPETPICTCPECGCTFDPDLD
jgi:hypothetical protein